MSWCTPTTWSRCADPGPVERSRRAVPLGPLRYRGAWCPYCNLALRTYQADLVPALAERGSRSSRSAHSG